MITFFLDLYDQLASYFAGANFSVILLIVKIVGYLLAMMLAILAGILLLKADATWWLRERALANRFAYGVKEEKKWARIMARLKKGDAANLKLAVIEADKLFDDILKRMGLPGQNMSERLKQFAENELPSLGAVWTAHLLRNAIINEPGMPVSYEQAEEALRGFESALKELEYL